jgi:ferric-dicitrate binding protein FerR (iron transport regulator)
MTEMAECSDIRDRVYSFVIGECDIDTAAAIRNHIRGCPACAEELKRMRAVVRLTGKLEKINPSRDLCREVLAQARPPLFWLKVTGAAAAAAVLVVVFLYALVGLPGSVPAPEGEEMAESVEKPEEVEIAGNRQTAPERPLERKKRSAPAPDSEREALAQKESGDAEREASPRKEPVRKEDGSGKSLVDLPAPESEGPEKAAVKKPVPGPEKEKPAVIARVGSAVGEFKVKRKGGSDWLEGKALLSIMPGDTVETNALGKVRVDLDGGDYIYMNTNSRINFAAGDEGILVSVGRGEVYCEKESTEGELTVQTGFGEVRSAQGRFDVKMFGANQCLLQVLSGEVKCRESEKGHKGKHGELTRTWLRRGKRCDRGTRLRTKEGFRWAVKLQPERGDEAGKQAGKPGKQGKPGKHDPGVPPGAVPKPGDPRGPKPGDGVPGGKMGPGPSPMPPPPGGGGPGPGNGHGPGGKQGGKR